MSEKEKEYNAEEEVKEQTTQNTEENAPEEQASSEETQENADSKEYGEAESEDPIQNLQKQVEEERNKYLRIYAEFENFRKRSAKERIDLIGSASADVLKELLPILDDFERAIESNKKVDDIESVKQGFDLLFQKFSRLMKSKGIEEVNPVNEDFDAEHHEAIAQMPATDDVAKGKIFDVVEKGYKLNDKIIRHPKVVVAS